MTKGKQLLFDEVSFIHKKMTEFENLFKKKPMKTSCSILLKKTVEVKPETPDRVYLIEKSWWQRWSDIVQYAKYCHAVSKYEKSVDPKARKIPEFGNATRQLRLTQFYGLDKKFSMPESESFYLKDGLKARLEFKEKMDKMSN